MEKMTYEEWIKIVIDTIAITGYMMDIDPNGSYLEDYKLGIKPEFVAELIVMKFENLD